MITTAKKKKKKRKKNTKDDLLDEQRRRLDYFGKGQAFDFNDNRERLYQIENHQFESQNNGEIQQIKRH